MSLPTSWRATDIINVAGAPFAAGDTAGFDGTNSSLTIGGPTIKSDAISNGIITFSTSDNFSAPLTLSSNAQVAAVVDYLQHNDLGNAGATVAFTATIGATPHTLFMSR